MNIAFTLKSGQKAFLRKGGTLEQLQNEKGETAYVAMKVVKGLGLKEVSKYHWRSDNGKVNVVCDPGKSHRGIAQTYVGEFMGAAADGVSSNASPLASTDQFVQSIEYNGEHLEEFLTKLDEFKKDPNKLQAFLDWAAKQTDMDVLRRANVLVGDDIKDHYLKHLKLSAAFLNKTADANGHASFEVNFGGNALAEWNIGAGHLLPFSVKAIKVYGKNGEVLFPYAERKTVDGRVGYYVPNTNQYAYVHSGYKVEVLGARDIPTKKGEDGHEEFSAEREVFAQDGDRFVVQDYVQRYFRDKLKLDIDVDSQYIVNNLPKLKEALAKKSPDWWGDYLSEKFTIDGFFEVFDAYFSKRIVLYKNIIELVKQDDKIKTITLSGLEGLIEDDKFKKLGEKELSAKELAEFKAKDLEGKELNEFIQSSPKIIELLGNAARIANERNPKSFVKGRCEQAVRQVASRAIELATGKPVGSMDGIRIRATKIEDSVTKALRSKPIKALTMADFSGLKPGLAIYMANKNKYASHGKDIKAGTSSRLPVINDTDRHWVMWDGVGFTDNWGTRRTLGDLKRLAGAKNRVVVNVHDPLGQYGVS